MVGLSLVFSKNLLSIKNRVLEILGSNLKELLKKKYFFRLLWILKLKDILQPE